MHSVELFWFLHGFNNQSTQWECVLQYLSLWFLLTICDGQNLNCACLPCQWAASRQAVPVTTSGRISRRLHHIVSFLYIAQCPVCLLAAYRSRITNGLLSFWKISWAYQHVGLRRVFKSSRPAFQICLKSSFTSALFSVSTLHLPGVLISP